MGEGSDGSGVAGLVQAFLALANPWIQGASQASSGELAAGGDGLEPACVVAELAYGLDQLVSAYLDDQGLDVEAYGQVQQQVLIGLAEDLQMPADPVSDSVLLDANGDYDLHAVLDAYGTGLGDGEGGDSLDG